MNYEALWLLVDEEPETAKSVREAAAELHLPLRLRVVNDGRKALDYLAGRGAYANRPRYPLPSLILLDLDLPESSGFEVLRWLKTQPGLRRITVIALSSTVGLPHRDRAYELGANSCLIKPRTYEAVRDTMRELAEYWLRFNQSPSDAFPHRGLSAHPRKRVLLVEDDPDTREALGAILTDEGFAVTAVRDGAEAIAVLRQNSSVAVIVLDLVLPGTDGWQFRAAQKEDPALASIPVLSISAYADRLKARPIDTPFLAKPFDPEQLFKAIDRSR